MSDLAQNRKAFYNYEVLETFEAGISLMGTEVKSLKNHGGSIQEAYVDIREGEIFLVGSNIAPYSTGSVFNHEEKRIRKLLMHKEEIKRLNRQMIEKGFSLIPIAIYLKQGKIKVKIAIARGKKSFDKRAKLKEKEDRKSIKHLT